IESEEIGTIGVGEATVPHLKLFNSVLEIDEVEFIREVRGTFKLGIQFVDWGRAGDRYIHGFGTIGHDYGLLPFHQYWLKLFLAGQAIDIGAYSLNTAAAPLGKFMSSAHDVPATSPLANITYAYHFDAGLYAAYLRSYAEARGRVAMAHSAAAPHRQRLRLLERLHRGRRSSGHPDEQSRRARADRAAETQVYHRHAQEVLEPQLRGGGTRERLHGAARVDQHLHDPVRYRAAHQPDAGPGLQSSADRALQQAGGVRVRAYPRLSDPALLRD